MPITVDSLKKSSSNAFSSAKNKFESTRSPSLKQTSYANSRASSVPSSSTASPRPPPRNPTPSASIDWQNLSPNDKNAFFQMLDGFFDQRSSSAPIANPSSDVAIQPPVPPARSTIQTHSTAQETPPKPVLWARPSSTRSIPQSSELTSYPGPTSTGSFASDLAQFFHHSFASSGKWFTQPSPLPPPLEGKNNLTWSSSWTQVNTTKTLTGAALFSDLSLALWQVTWDITHESRQDLGTHAQRRVKYVGRPNPWDGARLYESSQCYGETIAAFSEQAVATGIPVGRGECWDLASHALTHCEETLPRLVPSIARTHGALMYEGRAEGSKQVGRWYGGDISPRRGDIVEWRKARVSDKNSWSTLGDPDHTAVITNVWLTEEPGARQPSDGVELEAWNLGSLEVVEQSLGQRPKKSVYNLRNFDQGEIWIYRPVPIEQYLGISQVTPNWDVSLSNGVSWIE